MDVWFFFAFRRYVVLELNVDNRQSETVAECFISRKLQINFKLEPFGSAPRHIP